MVNYNFLIVNGIFVIGKSRKDFHHIFMPEHRPPSVKLRIGREINHSTLLVVNSNKVCENSSLKRGIKWKLCGNIILKNSKYGVRANSYILIVEGLLTF